MWCLYGYGWNLKDIQDCSLRIIKFQRLRITSDKLNSRITITAIAGGLCTAVGIGTFFTEYRILGFIVFSIGVANTYQLINMLRKEMDLKQIEFWFKYPGFAVILLGALIAIAQEGWNTLSLSMSYFGLFMLSVGLMVRSRRIKK